MKNVILKACSCEIILPPSLNVIFPFCCAHLYSSQVAWKSFYSHTTPSWTVCTSASFQGPLPYPWPVVNGESGERRR